MTELRSVRLATKSETFAAFARAASARVLAVAAVILLTVRLVVGGWGRGDLIALAVTLAITGTVEWFIHKFLLHASEDAWTSRRLGAGTGHRQHHLDPPALEWLLLGGLDAGVFIAAFGLVTAAWVIPLMWLTGSAVLGPFSRRGCSLRSACSTTSGCTCSCTRATGHERRTTDGWLATTAFTTSANEGYWLGVTTNSGDRILRTYPSQKADVPLSETARTLV